MRKNFPLSIPARRAALRRARGSSLRAAALFAAAPLALAQQYQVVDLGLAAGGVQSWPREINDAGVAVGETQMPNFEYRATLFGANGPQLLPTFGGGFDQGPDIDRKGRVLYMSNQKAYWWTASGGAQLLGAFWPNAMNEHGVVCGGTTTGASQWVRWDQQNGLQLLGNYPGGTYGAATDINAAGQMSGQGGVSGKQFSQPMRYEPGVGIQLLDVPGQPGEGEARCIGADGTCAGFAGVGWPTPASAHVWNTTAALYTSGAKTDLWDIDASGRCVGDMSTGSGQRAVLYVQGAAVDLNTLIPSGSGWVLERAFGINDAGQIVGTGNLNGAPRGYRLDPPSRVVVNGGKIGAPMSFVHDAPGFPLRLAVTGVSATGMASAVVVDGHMLRLDVDALTLALLATPAVTIAQLDGNGHGQTVAVVVPNDGALVGLELWVANAVFDAALPAVVATSGTVAVEIE